jgi:hypothetical protein
MYILYIILKDFHVERTKIKTILFPDIQISSLSSDIEKSAVKKFTVKNGQSLICTNWIARRVYKELHKFYWEYFKSNLVLF